MTVHEPTVERPEAPARRRSAASFVSDAFLNLLAIGGVICIIAVICAFAFNITLIMFKTGSMTPTIPTGSLAIVQKTHASDIRVGDVTTIDRPGQLPVTHRVTAIEPVGDGTFTFRMKGDANDDEDPAPYIATDVRKVLWHLPEVGYLVAKAQNPKVMAVTTLAMAILVTWAFWPRKKRVS